VKLGEPGQCGGKILHKISFLSSKVFWPVNLSVLSVSKALSFQTGGIAWGHFCHSDFTGLWRWTRAVITGFDFSGDGSNRL
jgi:hypothetical protein